MVAAMISCVRLRDLARLGRSRASSTAAGGRSAGPSASRDIEKMAPVFRRNVSLFARIPGATNERVGLAGWPSNQDHIVAVRLLDGVERSRGPRRGNEGTGVSLPRAVK